jgi:hypothetical protein
LDEHGERHVAAERLEARPQHPDVGRPEADRAADGQRAAARVAYVGDRGAHAGRERGWTLRQPGQVARAAVAAREPLDAALDVLRDQRDQQEDGDHDRRHDRGHHGPAEGRVARQDVGPQQDPEHDQRHQVDAVGQDHERDHAAGRAAPGHARLAQRPVGEDDPAGPGRGEDPRGRQPGHRDLVRRVEVEPALDRVLARAPDHAAEQRDVGDEGEHVDPDGDHDPVPDRVVELADRVVEAD